MGFNSAFKGLKKCLDAEDCFNWRVQLTANAEFNNLWSLTYFMIYTFKPW